MSSEQKPSVPPWEKYALTVDEAAAYFGIGEKKIRELSRGPDCRFVLWVGNKRLIKHSGAFHLRRRLLCQKSAKTTEDAF